jgi:hypothetical protein
MAAARVATWFVIGLMSALAVHYMLYRLTLPIKPFIYQAF